VPYLREATARNQDSPPGADYVDNWRADKTPAWADSTRSTAVADTGRRRGRLLYSLLYDRPLTRSFHVLGSTAAFLVKAGFLVVWLPLDVYGFRLVLARGWHDRLGQSVWELVCHAVGDQHITGQSSSQGPGEVVI